VAARQSAGGRDQQPAAPSGWCQQRLHRAGSHRPHRPELRRCAAAWAEFVRPDGYGLWTEAGRRVAFCLEYDTGTEHLPQLAGKLAGYADLAAVLDQPPWLLFVLPSRRRETEARRVLRTAALPIATAVDDPASSAAGARWWPLGLAEQRCRLAALPGLLENHEAAAADPAAGAA